MTTFTKEQQALIYCDDSEIYVNAKAGTGKTTTLIEFTKQRPADIFLYLVYNRKNKIEAEKKFLYGNVKIETIHSLAYKYIGRKYAHKLSNNIKIFDVIYNIEMLRNAYEADKTNFEVFLIASNIIECLELFFNKAYDSIEDTSSAFPKQIIQMADEYFQKMIDIEDEKVKLTHNGYLKLFQLQNPKLNYDYILVDEAQDSNEIMLSIVQQSNAKKVFVGDEYQAIYGFRHNVNIFNLKGKDTTELFLTKSFRFGESIAFYANVLNQTFRENPIMVQGNDSIKDLVFDAPERSITDRQYTVLTRTNAHLFDLAARYALLNKTIFIVGEQEIFQELLDAMHLYNGELHKIKNPTILEFKNFEKLRQVAQNSTDPELKFLVKVVEKYEENIANIIHKIQSQTIKEVYADITLCTAHKSKGLEWYNVILGTDFPELLNKEGQVKTLEEIDIEEINLLYVAITRAMERLYLNDTISDFFNKVL